MSYVLGYATSVLRRTWPVVTGTVLGWGAVALLLRLAEYAVRSGGGPSWFVSALGAAAGIVAVVLLPLSALGYVARVVAREGAVVAAWTVAAFVAEVLLLLVALWLGLWLAGAAPTLGEAWQLITSTRVAVR